MFGLEISHDHIKATVRNRRIDVPAPSDIPDGTEVTLTIAQNDDNAPMPPEEIARVLAAMQKLEALDIPRMSPPISMTGSGKSTKGASSIATQVWRTSSRDALPPGQRESPGCIWRENGRV